MLFASAGYKVSMYDVEKTQVDNALDNILVLLKVQSHQLLHVLIVPYPSIALSVTNGSQTQRFVPASYVTLHLVHT